jgi:hypothetical protein
MAGNQNVIPTWMSQGALNIPGQMHDLPKHPERLLPKFDPDKSCSPEYHINNFYLAIHLLDVQHEDVVCRLFPYTFENKASTWYYNLLVRSIRSWDNFEKYFISKFEDEKTPAMLFKELVALKMEKKEKVKYFNQCFTTILNKFPA